VFLTESVASEWFKWCSEAVVESQDLREDQVVESEFSQRSREPEPPIFSLFSTVTRYRASYSTRSLTNQAKTVNKKA